MSAFKTLTAKDAADILLGVRDPVILIHVHPDADCVGTCRALAELFFALGKKPSYISEDDIPKRLEFLIEDLPRVENSKGRDLISVDVASPKQGGAPLLCADTPVLMIDHHSVGEPFADGYIVPDASSAAEVLLDIIDELISMGKITLSAKIAAPLFAAMSSDTGGFRFSSATPKTFRAAARLIETGIDHADISHRLFFSKSIGEIRAEGFISGKVTLLADGRCAIATLSKSERNALGLSDEDFACAIDVIRSIAGVEVAVFLRELGGGCFKASLRSVGKNVAAVAQTFGGGGHIRAAGCTINADSIESARELLVSRLLQLF